MGCANPLRAGCPAAQTTRRPRARSPQDPVKSMVTPINTSPTSLGFWSRQLTRNLGASRWKQRTGRTEVSAARDVPARDRRVLSQRPGAPEDLPLRASRKKMDPGADTIPGKNAQVSANCPLLGILAQSHKAVHPVISFHSESLLALDRRKPG